VTHIGLGQPFNISGNYNSRLFGSGVDIFQYLRSVSYLLSIYMIEDRVT